MSQYPGTLAEHLQGSFSPPLIEYQPVRKLPDPARGHRSPPGYAPSRYIYKPGGDYLDRYFAGLPAPTAFGYTHSVAPDSRGKKKTRPQAGCVTRPVTPLDPHTAICLYWQCLLKV